MPIVEPINLETWLDLRDRGGSPSEPPEPLVRMIQGTPDSFPNAPGSYDQILVSVTRNFLRWNRWYFQCFARQLKVNGLLILVPVEDPVDHPGRDKICGIRQRLGRMRWAVAAQISAIAAWLIPTGVSENAEQYGLRLQSKSKVRGAEEGRGAICFLKGKGPDHCLDEMFNRHFGSWGDKSVGVSTPSGIQVTAVGDLTGNEGPGTVLVLSPHPDDELIGCGGTLLSLLNDGWKVHVIQMTEGVTCRALRGVNDDLSRKVRWDEAETVSAHFDFKTHYWATGSDGVLSSNPETQAKLRVLLRELQPKVIFAPSAADRHPEHRLAREILGTVADGIPTDCRVFEYPVWGFLPEPSHAVEVTDTYPAVLEALYLYPTAMKAEDYVTRCRVLGSYFGKSNLGDASRSVEVFSFVPEPGSSRTCP